jgi:hypothetical protein
MTKRFYLLVVLLLQPLAPGQLKVPTELPQQTDIAIIVNTANPVNNLSMADLRRMLTGDRRFWRGNVQVKLALREPGSRERDRVLYSVARVSNKEFIDRWRAKIFRGEASEAPVSFSSDAEASRFLTENPGGMTFLPRGSLPRWKVLKLEGKLPGETGYALK